MGELSVLREAFCKAAVKCLLRKNDACKATGNRVRYLLHTGFREELPGAGTGAAEAPASVSGQLRQCRIARTSSEDKIQNKKRACCEGKQQAPHINRTVRRAEGAAAASKPLIPLDKDMIA